MLRRTLAVLSLGVLLMACGDNGNSSRTDGATAAATTATDNTTQTDASDTATQTDSTDTATQTDATDTGTQADSTDGTDTSDSSDESTGTDTTDAADSTDAGGTDATDTGTDGNGDPNAQLPQGEGHTLDQIAMDWTLKDGQGNSVNLYDYYGKVIYFEDGSEW